MPVREFGNYRDILIAVRKRVAEVCADGNHDAVYIAIDPDAVSPPPSGANFFYVVSPLAGTFDESYLMGGGQMQATVESGILVTIYSTVQLDEGQKHGAFLTDLSLSLVERWRHLLAAMTDWTPELNDVQMTRDPFLPSGFEFRKRTRALASVEQAFRLCFDWYLEMPGVDNPELPDE
jgi:hypothetical protein